MLQKAQHCAPKKERIYPLQFLEGVYGNSVRAEKSLRTLPEKKVLKFSRNAFQKKHTSSSKQNKIEIYTPYLFTFSSQQENKNFDPPRRY